MATEVSQPTRRAPRQSIDTLGWLRQNLFNNWYNALISLVLLVVVFQLLSGIIGWLLSAQGWPAVVANLKLLMTWTYPIEHMWRPQLSVWLVALLLGLSGGAWRGIPRALAIGFGIAMLVLGALIFILPGESRLPISGWATLLIAAALTAASVPIGARVGERLRWPLIAAWVLLYPLVIVIIRGGLGLPIVESNLWGGLMLTLLLSASGIVLSFPIGVLLALGRRSDLPVVKWFCIAYIELIRGVPLVTVLFMGSLMLPLFLPGGENIDGLVRATVAVTLFSAAYLAENVRGGLQSLPKGQAEAARALGLNVFQTTMLITLPQALRAVIPVLVGQFISLFKDTSLVVIVGLTDLLGAAQATVTQPEWLGTPGGVWRETFLTIAAIYWVFSFTMSRTSKQIEANLNVGNR
jgi:general L-amino acid transport system permease protein